jgi:hypothetical protein
MWTCRWVPAFRRNILSPSAGLNMEKVIAFETLVATYFSNPRDVTAQKNSINVITTTRIANLTGSFYISQIPVCQELQCTMVCIRLCNLRTGLLQCHHLSKLCYISITIIGHLLNISFLNIYLRVTICVGQGERTVLSVPFRRALPVRMYPIHSGPVVEENISLSNPFRIRQCYEGRRPTPFP